MSVELLIWLCGAMFTITTGLMGVIWRSTERRFVSIERTLKQVTERTDFAGFQEMDKKREDLWMRWREDRDQEQRDLAARLGRMEIALSRIEGRLNGKLT